MSSTYFVICVYVHIPFMVCVSWFRFFESLKKMELKKMPMDPLTVPVPAGVSPDELVRAIGTFIGLNCNPYRNPSPDTNFNGNLYVARYTKGSVEHVAVVNATNLPEQEARRCTSL